MRLRDRPISPPLWRVVLAFVAAPISAVIFLMLSGALHVEGQQVRIGRDWFVFYVLAQYAAVLLGVPLYAVLRQYVRRPLLGAVVTGVLLVVNPLVLPWIGPWSERSTVGAMVQDLTSFALTGATGGFVFWFACLGRFGRRGHPK